MTVALYPHLRYACARWPSKSMFYPRVPYARKGDESAALAAAGDGEGIRMGGIGEREGWCDYQR